MNFETPQNITDEQLKKQTLAREHLKEGVPHIVFNLIHGGSDYKNSIYKEAVKKIENNGYKLNVTYEDRMANRTVGVIDCSHMISHINERDKFSLGYKNCIGAVLVGKSKTTGKEISFIIHIDSSYIELEMGRKYLEEKKAALGEKYLKENADFLKSLDDFRKENAEMFSKAFDDNMEELLNNCENKSVDAVVFGGASYDIERYEKVIAKISQNIKDKLGFEPVILTGPGGLKVYEPEYKEIDANTEAYFDTQGRKLYLVRYKVPDENMDKPYYASQNTRKEEK